MGDPKKLKKKYSRPMHPWNKTTIDEEKVLSKEYGLRNKREIFIAVSTLKKYKDIAKSLVAKQTAQSEKEKKLLLEKVQKYGLLRPGTVIDDILSVQLKDVLERRLQSLICRRGLARTMRQARQFVTHRHFWVGDKEITSPSALLTLEEESHLRFKPNSGLSKEDHPERVGIGANQIKEEAAALKKSIKKIEKGEAPPEAA